MSLKRSRDTFESDPTTQHSAFVVIGTPLPAPYLEARDDGSFVPIHKQEVRDEKGRRRLHGAFTGGWSAGYFNTVGSKEGWTPSAFVSSRSSRRKDGAAGALQRPEDFMDEEDLADAADTARIQTAHTFTGLGSTPDTETTGPDDLGLLPPTRNETMGLRLLNRMGWKVGQGIGPRIRRAARLGIDNSDGKSHLFAPDATALISLPRTPDRIGLGFQREPSRPPKRVGKDKASSGAAQDPDRSDDDSRPLLFRPRVAIRSVQKPKAPRGSIGVGILNDTGSDEEDPYEIGPRISYNRTLNEGKKKKVSVTVPNPKFRTKPIFLSRAAVPQDPSQSLHGCQDGRPPLRGFILGNEPDTVNTVIDGEAKYPPSIPPPGWTWTKQPDTGADVPPYTSTMGAAKVSRLDPKTRAALLGEQQLPGKSVFDFMTPAARERLVAASGKHDLPPAMGETLPERARPEEDRMQDIRNQAPLLDRETALAVLTRGTGPGMPYKDDEAKMARYRGYLEYHAGLISGPPSKPALMSSTSFAAELQEFYNCTRIFRPMTGFMAAKFTTSGVSAKANEQSANQQVRSTAQPEPLDSAHEAAKLGMYGRLTRSTQDFFPSRLLCKRFNVKVPSSAQAAGPSKAGSASISRAQGEFYGQSYSGVSSESSGEREAPRQYHEKRVVAGQSEMQPDTPAYPGIEAERPKDEVFKAIFGDSSEEE